MFFQTRGLVVFQAEIAALDLPRRAWELGLNSLDAADGYWLANHEAGREFVNQCRRFDIEVVYANHVVSSCLPRALFEQEPEMFRMNEQGERTPDANLCVHSEVGLAVFCENVLRYISVHYPASHRYYLWTDDAQPMCRCPVCGPYSDSDQALIMENRLLQAIRTVDPRAKLAHLAYSRTLAAPTRVRPEPGIFLQFAPIEQAVGKPLADAEATDPRFRVPHRQLVEALDANLKVFGAEEAEVLGYWLDVSRQWLWDRGNAKPLEWDRESFLEDLRLYARRGIRRIRTYAAWIDGEYLERFGMPAALQEYAEGLRRWRLAEGKAVETLGEPH